MILDLLGLLVPLALLALLAPSGLLDRLEQRVQQALTERQEQLDHKALQALWEQQEPQVLREPLEPQDQ